MFECNLCFALVGPGEECACVHEDWYSKSDWTEEGEDQEAPMAPEGSWLRPKPREWYGLPD